MGKIVVGRHTTTINVENEWRMILKIIGIHRTKYCPLPSALLGGTFKHNMFQATKLLVLGKQEPIFFRKTNNCKCILAITATPLAQLLQIVGKIAIFKVKKPNKCMW